MTTVIIQDLQNVWLDGVNTGALVDAVRNHPEAAPAISEALAEWKSGQQDAQPRQAQQVLLSGLTTLSKEFSEAMEAAGSLVRTATVLRLADTLALTDFSGPLAGRTPDDVRTLLAFVQAVTALAAQAPIEGGPTYSESILSFALAAQSASPSPR